MAIDVHTLLTLPSSKAFSSFRSTNLGTLDDTRSDSPPRKTPRLAADSDSASASRSRPSSANNRTDNNENSGPVLLTLQGAPIKPHADSFYDAHFNLVRASVRELLDEKGKLPTTYANLYTTCRAVVCEARRGEGLYENLRLSMEQCVGKVASQLLALQAHGVAWLGPFVEACEWFERRVSLLESLLAYLDQGYVATHRDLLATKQLSYSRFADRVFGDEAIVVKIQDSIKAWCEWERQHEAEHELRRMIPKLIGRLIHHGQYQRIFESFYLKVTSQFYLTEGTHLRETHSAKKFLDRCAQRDIQEQKRSESVLPVSSWAEVKATIVKAQLADRLPWLANEAVPGLMKVQELDGFKRIYTMFAAVDGLKVLKEVFKSQVEKSVRGIVEDKTDEEHMVSRLLAYKAFGDKLVSDVFVTEVKVPQLMASKASTSTASAGIEAVTEKVPDRDFGYALIDSFQKGFKARRNKPAELIAKYIDKAMRKGQKGKDDKDYSAELDAALGLYRFTDDKDVFRAFYHRALAKRLLLEKSASDDHERSMLKKLKEEYDPEFGMGDQMFTDLALSRELMKEYTAPREDRDNDASAHRLSVMVLQRSVWPFTARKQDVALPEWMGEELQSFMNFYKRKHSGHKLDWDHSLGTATLRASFKGGDKELSVSLYQAIILLLFNEGEQKPFSEIKMLTQMGDTELRRTLQSLACGKKRVLKKQPPGRDVNDGDIFLHNADFTDPAFRVHINSIQVKETVEETQRTQSLIEGDRKYALDAAIVRVMKGKKQLHYEQLKTATIEAVKNHFKPDIPMIKQRIDSLVEQDYLKRDEDDMNLLMYVA